MDAAKTVDLGREGIGDLTPWAIILIVAIGAALRVHYFSGIIGSDDIFHAGAALSILERGFTVPEIHTAARFGLHLPTLPLFHFFGIGDWQMGLVPLFWSLLSIFLAYWLGAYFIDRNAGLIAAILIAVFPLDIQEATRLYPDLPLGACAALSVFAFLFAEQRNRPLLGAVLAGLAWGYAYLIKVEAFFLGFAYLGLLIQRPERFRAIVLCGLVVLSIVALETAVYFVATGELFYRLLITQNEMITSGKSGSLWVFPKSWFVTFHNFGIHYYLLFAGFILALVHRESRLLTPILWSAAFLLWLQFGFSPFKEFTGFKSHLARYCAMLSVPMAIVAAYPIWRALTAWPRPLAWGLLGVAVAAGLFMTNFNHLGLERQVATKNALRQAEERGWFPLYLDTYSYAFARFIWQRTPLEARIHRVQDHNRRTGETELMDLNAIDGYLLVNRDSMRFRQARYFEDPVDLDLAARIGEKVYGVSNPLGELSYAQARLFLALAEIVPPVGALFRSTAEHVLEGNEAVIYDLTSKGQ